MHAEYNSFGSRARARIRREALRSPFGSAQAGRKATIPQFLRTAPLLREPYEHDFRQNTSNVDNKTR
jgi:hypothetical protein